MIGVAAIVWLLHSNSIYQDKAKGNLHACVFESIFVSTEFVLRSVSKQFLFVEMSEQTIEGTQRTENRNGLKGK